MRGVVAVAIGAVLAGASAGVVGCAGEGAGGEGEGEGDAGEGEGDEGEGDEGEGDEGEGDEGEGEGEGDVAPTVIFPRAGIGAAELGVVVNTNDPQSVAVAEAYVAARGIPSANVVEVAMPVQAVITPEDFATAKAIVDGAMPASVQALALTWTQPYGVGCMSIGTAFGVAYDEARFCSVPCAPTEASPFYDADTHAPFTDLGIRPVMMLAAESADAAGDLIARGVAADGTLPQGTAYLVSTTDAARTVREFQFPALADEWAGTPLPVALVDDEVANADDVLFYFTGLASVPDVATNTYLPGAVADHLTSFGGQVPTASGQMSDIEWLKAGATASSGTVIEPCNFTQKFSDPRVVLERYFHGEPLIEAYAKSVQMPGESLLVGEPLSSPWDASTSSFVDGTLTLETNLVRPGQAWVVAASDAADGPFTVVAQISSERHERVRVVIPDATARFYRLAEADEIP